MKIFSRNKWLVFCLIMVMVFTLMPVNYDIAGGNGVIADETYMGDTSEPSENPTESTTEDQLREEEATMQDINISEQMPNIKPNEERTEDNSKDKDAVHSDNIDTMNGKKGLLEETLDSKLAGVASDLLDNTTIRLDKLTLEASYKDKDGKTQVINMTMSQTTTLPNDAAIDMSFNFIMGDGNSVDCNKDYVYKIPDGVRVDVNATHELMDGEGKSIGRVVISKDGTLTFTFYESAVQGQEQIPFYVKFSGGFSSELQENIGEHQISFPTASGEFTYKVDITESNQETENQEPGELKAYKSGTKVYRDGSPYIQWTVEVDLNGRDSLTADVVDNLPAGLTYIPGSAVLSGEGNASASVTASVEGSKVTFHIQDSKPYWRTNLTFLTSYDESIFPSNINNTSGVTINNTVAVNPENEEKGAEGSGTAYVTPTVLEKSGILDVADSAITWTVTINKDQLDIAGTTYTDIFGTGLELDTSYGTGGFMVSPSGTGTVTSTGIGGFTFTPAGTPNTNTITITYKTTVDNISQPSFQNRGTLTGRDYNASVEANVSGMNLIQKTGKSYNEITKQFTWNITVNEAGIELTDAVVKDIFDGTKMTFVSAVVTNADGSVYEDASVGGTQIHLGTITDKKVITIVTQLNEADTVWNENGWYNINNQAVLEWDGNKVSSDANISFQYKVPDLLDKDGVLTGNGTIQWTLHVKQPQLKQESVKISDILPADMEYVDGTFQLMYFTYAWDSSQMMYVTPSYDNSTNLLSYEFDRDSISDTYYINNSFVVRYETRLKDRADADKNGSYTNNASIEVNYEGNVKVTDTASKTVEGTVGGTLGKEYVYNSGKDYVDWSVMINEAGYDMSGISNPIIKDKLEDYFDYVSGTLYKIVNGTRQEVPASDYVLVVINNNITVKLPDIGTDTYEFAFRTRFNISAAKLESRTIKNTVDFTGEGYSESVSSDEVKNVSFSSSSAGSVLEKELRIKKVDSVTGAPLKGAEFELFYKGVSCGTAITGDDGFAIFTGISSDIAGITYTLYENEAPDGYVKKSAEETVTIYDAALQTDASGIRYIEHVVQNDTIERNTQIHIYKTDLDNRVLAGAEFSLYSDSACRNLVTTRKTDESGLAVFTVKYDTNVPLLYFIKETKAPDGYLEPPSTVHTVTIHTDGRVGYNSSTVTVGGVTALNVTNIRAQAVLTIEKVEKGNAGVKIPGARFALYLDAACTDLVDEQITGPEGMLVFSNLELGKTYYYRETEAPSGYVLDSAIRSVIIGDGTEHENIAQTVTVENTAALGFIEVIKTDDNVPANVIEGVEFTLYKGDNTLYTKEDGTNYIVATDSTGKAVFENLPFGTYIVKETKGMSGYVASADVSVVVDSTVGSKVTVVNDVMKFKVEITKTDDSLPANPLEGVTFVLYKKNGMAVASGKTDDNGKLTFQDIPYGDYYIKETAGIRGYVVSDDIFVITAAMDIVAQNQVFTHTFVNKKENGTIQFKKKAADDGSGTTNYLQGAEFTLYDSNGLKVIDAFSDSTGTVTFADLIYDTYTIRETKAPNDYKLDNTEWIVTVTENKTYTQLYKVLDPHTGYAEIDNEKLPGTYNFLSFHLKKVDQDDAPLRGAEFELSKQVSGSTDWTLMATAYSDVNGIVQFHNISIETDANTTQYKLEEVAAPTGYRLDPSNCTKIYTYKELTEMQTGGSGMVGHVDKKPETEFTNVPEIASFANQQILGAVRISKTGLTSLVRLKGAEFTLYQSDSTTVYKKADGAEYRVVTDENGVAVFENLPVGYYVVKETGAPQGYTVNTLYAPGIQILDETVKDITFTDTQINISVSKQAVGGTSELADAELAVYDSNDVLIESWTTTTTEHKLKADRLKTGEIYTLKELRVPDGYKSASAVKFVINLDGTLTYLEGDGSVSGKAVIMRDSPLELSIEKRDEAGAGLGGALLELIDDATGSSIYSFTSDGSTKNIPGYLLKAPERNGEYTYCTIHEKSAPGGYELAEDIKIAIAFDGSLYQVDGTNLISAANPIIMSDKVKQDFYFNKVDKGTGSRLTGALLELTKEGGSVVERWTSSSAPKNIALTDGTYVLREVLAPNGYTVAEPITFSVAGGRMMVISGDAASLSYDKLTITMKDSALNVRVRKLTESFAVLPGASFDLYESDSNSTRIRKLESFVTDNNAVVLDNRNLKTDTWYLLIETKAPSGYELAEPVLFYIDNNGAAKNQFGEAYDSNLIEVLDTEKRLCVQKIDAATGAALAGVTLCITSKEDTGFTAVNWVTDGTPKYFAYSDFEYDKTYTLSELQTVNGYTYTASIDFTINSSDELVYSNGNVLAENRIVMENNSFEVFVSKVSLKTSAPLKGAVLAIKDTSGNILEQWISDAAPHKLDSSRLCASLNNENVYILSEIQAPDGYALAQSISFIIDKNGKVKRLDGETVTDNTIVMRDEYHGIAFSKQDAAGKEISGAKLTIICAEDDDFKTVTWESTDTPKNWNMDLFKRNTDYILSEEAAPNGYAYAENIIFRIDDNGVVYVNGVAVTDQTVTMVDESIRLLVAKKIKGTDKYLSGAKLSIVDKASGATIYTWKTKNDKVEIPTKYLTASRGKQNIIYVLKEAKAPKGYKLAEDIYFYIDESGKVYTIDKDGNETQRSDQTITMYDAKDKSQKTGSNTDKSTDGSAKTGDADPIEKAAYMMFVSIGAFLTLLYWKKKRH